MPRIARFEIIKHDVELLVKDNSYLQNSHVLSLPYEALIFKKEHLIGITKDFEPKKISTDEIAVIGDISLYGFQTCYNPDLPMCLVVQADE